jgi:hypothetical protein
MKKLILTSLLISSSFYACSLSAEEVVNELGSLRKWKAQKVEDHKAWGEAACLAFTTKDNSRLEVYAEENKDQQDEYIEPTVQITANSGFAKFLRAEMKIDNRRDMSFNLTLANKDQQNGTQVALARLSDREKIIELLRAKNTATVNFYDESGKRVESVRYSLSGSSRSIGTFQFPKCDLKFSELTSL